MNAKQAMHPLFDPMSFYRAATRESVWDDRGDRSVRRFFVSRAREELARQWMLEIPQEVQPWGYGPEVDREIDDLLRSRSLAPAEVPASDALTARAGGEPPPKGGPPTPALVVLDLESSPAPAVPRRTPAHLFTGVGRPPNATGIGDFKLELTYLAPRRRIAVLILTAQLLVEVAKLLDRPDLSPDETWAIGTITAAMDPATLWGRESTAALRRAYRLGCTLALAPGLEGRTSPTGKFQAQVRLPRACPGLDFGTWVVACLGPAATDEVM